MTQIHEPEMTKTLLLICFIVCTVAQSVPGGEAVEGVITGAPKEQEQIGEELGGEEFGEKEFIGRIHKKCRDQCNFMQCGKPNEEERKVFHETVKPCLRESFTELYGGEGEIQKRIRRQMKESTHECRVKVWKTTCRQCIVNSDQDNGEVSAQIIEACYRAAYPEYHEQGNSIQTPPDLEKEMEKKLEGEVPSGVIGEEEQIGEEMGGEPDGEIPNGNFGRIRSECKEKCNFKQCGKPSAEEKQIFNDFIRPCLRQSFSMLSQLEEIPEEEEREGERIQRQKGNSSHECRANVWRNSCRECIMKSDGNEKRGKVAVQIIEACYREAYPQDETPPK